jgi:hypothetical protein
LEDVRTGILSSANSGGTHTSRTMLLSELTMLLAAIPPDASQDVYRTAIVDDNVLGKKTLNSRQRSYRYLRELYGLDPGILLFRALRDLWEADAQAQPLLAMLCSLARDPALRATAPAVLPLPQGEAVTADDLARALMDRYPGTYSDAVANKVGRNAASSWTQSGHLAGHTSKTRARAACGPAAVAYALLLGHLEGAVGERLFTTLWAQVLDVPRTVVLEHAMTASQRGWIELRHGGGITDITFRLLLRDFPGGPPA